MKRLVRLSSQAWASTPGCKLKVRIAWRALDAAQRALAADRQALFDGQPVRTVELAMAAALQAARAAALPLRSLSKLVAYMMKTYHIPADHVIGHRPRWRT